MKTIVLNRILVLLILVCLLLTCKDYTIPVDPEIKDPVAVKDSWTLLPGSPGNPVWAMFLGEDGILYAGVEKGFVRSLDNGLSWELIYSSGTPNVIYVSPYDGEIILSLTGTFRSTTVYSIDNGKTWRPSVTQPGGSISLYLALPGGDLLAGGFVHDESAGGLFISKDKGVTWIRVPDLVKEPTVLSLTLNSANDVYAAIRSSVPGGKTEIFCSKDKAQTWSQVIKPDSLIINKLVINRNNSFIVSTDKNIFISENNEDKWKSLLSYPVNGYIQSLEIDSNDNLVTVFYDLKEKKLKVLLYSKLNDKWYSIDGLTYPISGCDISAFIGKDHHIYLYTFDCGIYKTKQSIDTILKEN